MGINKIKLKQIDADFSGLVGQYGSGYFATTGSLDSLSGSSVPYSYIATGGFLYNAGSQSISGVKNFFSRPTLSGKGLAKLEEVVTSGSTNTFIAPNTFDSSSVGFKYSSLVFTSANFSMDSYSATGLASALTPAFSSNFVNTTTGLAPFAAKLSGKNPIATINGTGFDGSKDIVVKPSGNNFNLLSGTGYLLFNSTFLNGYRNVDASPSVYIDFNTTNPLVVSPPLFACSTISGTYLWGGVITGNRINANNCYATRFSGATFSGAANMYSNTFSGNTFSGVNMYASTFVGALSGNSISATSSSALNISTLSAADSINFNFPAATISYVMNSGAFYATPVTGSSITARNLGLTANRWNNIFAGTSTIGASDRNLKTEISEIPDSWLDAWAEVDYVRYKFKDSVAEKGLSGARWHVGHIAQEIYEKFQNHDLNAFNIGMVCYDKWDQSVDENGNITPSGEIWSIRPDECQFMEMALTRRSLNRLKSGILI
jgi:hypothetical protein